MARRQSEVLLGGRYRLIHRLASGGMGSVWEAEDTLLGRRVGVKVLSDVLAGDPRFVARFRREARAAASLSHPNVAGVFDYGEEEGTAYIVMELIDGETLASRLRRDGRLPPREAARIAAEAASALAAAHAAGVVHRDVKPANVMLDRAGRVKVMDFGIASVTAAARERLTATGQAIGTAAYISPEQAAGRPATPASDVYSLGAVLYEMVAGRPPFQSESPVATVVAHINRRPEPLAVLAPEVPQRIAAAADQALAKEPSERPPSACAFAAMLAEPEPAPTLELGVGTEPVPASSRRRPRTAPVLLVLTTLLVGAAILAAVLRSGNSPGSAGTPSGGGLVRVPAVIGTDTAGAEAAIRQARLVPEVVLVQGPQGVVVRQAPGGGALVNAGGTVTLYVGTPPSPQGGTGNNGKHKRKGKGEGD